MKSQTSEAECAEDVFLMQSPKNLMKQIFVKLTYPWHDMIINPPFRIAPSIFFFPSAMKSFQKKFMERGVTMSMFHWKIM